MDGKWITQRLFETGSWSFVGEEVEYGMHSESVEMRSTLTRHCR
jgi:hypothetical protein